MPTISFFFGLIIRMYYKDHQPPHIHVQYQSYNAVIDIASGNLSGGELPFAPTTFCAGMGRNSQR
jgi:hypothetical protein